MDLHMPEIDGFQATRCIRRLNNNREKPIIVAMTASASKEDRENCFASGMNDFLIKPVRNEDLLKVLGKYFSKLSGIGNVEKSLSIANKLDREMDFNLHELSVNLGNDSSFVHEVLNIFVSESQSSIQELDSAIGNRVPIEILKAAHKLKGIYKNIAAHPAAEIACHIENMGRKEQIENVEVHLEKLKTLANKVQSDVTNYLKKNQAS